MASAAGRGKATRARLDPQAIVAAGLEIAGQPGVSTVSVRDLGARLGADPTAIYRHFRSKDDLMAALLDDLNAHAVSAVTADRAQWEDRLRQLATATLDWYSRYPAIGAEATTLTTHGPGESAAIETMLDAFRHAGLEGRALVQHYALMASHTLSVAAGIARATAANGSADRSTSPWFDAPMLADARSYPLLAELSPMLNDLQDRELFLLGVETIIDAARRAAG